MAEDSEQTGEAEAREPEADRWLDFKGINVFFAVVVGLAVIGFFVGTHGDPYEAQLAGFADDVERAETDVEPARAYRELMDNPYFANEHWQRELERLSERQRPARTDEVERTPEMTTRALDERREHRAYEGAPPTVPHPIREQGYAECMACHGDGVEITGDLAVPMSHDYMANCTQCHVPETGSIPTADDRYDELPVDNRFAGLARFGQGDRAYPGAPPTNPHPENMREDCLSCHGPMGRPGIRTTHPEKTNCTQCHAPSATLDQHPRRLDLEPIHEVPAHEP